MTMRRRLVTTVHRRAHAQPGARLGPAGAARIVAASALAAAGLIAAAAPAQAGNYVSISGSGSSWASVAIDQWAQDVRPSGL